MEHCTLLNVTVQTDLFTTTYSLSAKNRTLIKYIQVVSTHHSLGQPNIVSGGLAGWLVGPPGVPQDGELLHSSYAALTQASELDPVSIGGFVRVYYEIVSFTCNFHYRHSVFDKYMRACWNYNCFCKQMYFFCY